MHVMVKMMFPQNKIVIAIRILSSQQKDKFYQTVHPGHVRFTVVSGYRAIFILFSFVLD
jgi:hypothetical protein